jgi:hypothetical protein
VGRFSSWARPLKIPHLAGSALVGLRRSSHEHGASGRLEEATRKSMSLMEGEAAVLMTPFIHLAPEQSTAPAWFSSSRRYRGYVVTILGQVFEGLPAPRCLVCADRTLFRPNASFRGEGGGWGT